MTKLDKKAIALAEIICHPAGGLELGMISEQLMETLQLFTKGNKKLRERTHSYIELMVEDGDVYIDAYNGNLELALNDADRRFF